VAASSSAAGRRTTILTAFLRLKPSKALGIGHTIGFAYVLYANVYSVNEPAGNQWASRAYDPAD